MIYDFYTNFYQLLNLFAILRAFFTNFTDLPILTLLTINFIAVVKISIYPNFVLLTKSCKMLDTNGKAPYTTRIQPNLT